MERGKGVIEIMKAIILGIIIIAIIGGLIYWATIEYQNEQTIEIIVKDKYIKRYGDKDIYLVVTEEGSTYKISDLFWKGKFNSTDLYNQLEIYKSYKITVTGIRLHFFNMYKNINKIEKVD